MASVYLQHTTLESAGLSVALDACLTGVGGICGTEMYHTELASWILQDAHHITHVEMLNIVVACKLWKHSWSPQQVTIHCDNIACVQILQTGRGRDPFLLQCARAIWLLSALHDFSLVAQHLPGRDNTLPDCLSRWHLDVAFQDRFWAHAGEQPFHEVDADPRLFKLRANI